MNEVSIIINGVKYDEVERNGRSRKCMYCDIYSHCKKNNNLIGVCNISTKDVFFKKFNKKFER